MKRKILKAQTEVAGVWAFIASGTLCLQPAATLAGVGMGLRVVVLTGHGLSVSVTVTAVLSHPRHPSPCLRCALVVL
jgi:hypothetical protein